MAGKTGSAQTISNTLKAKMSASEKEKYKDNGWFVGVEPRRNPEIVVCALFEEGEHGSLAAHVVSKVIQAYVEKQRRQPTKMAATQTKSTGKAEIGAVWTVPDEDGGEQNLQGGHFFLEIADKRLAAMAVPQ
jgi:penicillin-binding protein 2